MSDAPAPADLRHIVEETERWAARSGGRAARRTGGWDSHLIVQLIFAVEDAYGFQMTSAEMESVTDLPSLARIVAARAAA